MAVRVEILPATLAHAAAMAPQMRLADREEIWAMSRQDPASSLRHGVMTSRAPYVGLADGEIACMFGVAPISTLAGTGAIWMLGTDRIERHARAFLRANRQMLPELARGFSYLHNYVDARNTKSIRWLQWLGFTIHEPEPYGPLGLPFHHFEMRPHV